ncbi:MAG: hypothetical protein NZ482_03660 [Gloeomargarita sp. SKYG98]|nr:hypothetical protein [Gloeomargarita sp. SKYG98]
MKLPSSLRPCQPSTPLPEGVLCNKRGQPLPIVYLRGHHRAWMSCWLLPWQPGIQQVKLAAKRALVLDDDGHLYIMYRTRPGARSFAPLLLDVVATEPVVIAGGVLYGPDPHPPLTGEQIELATKLEMPLCRRPGGSQYLAPWYDRPASVLFEILGHMSRLFSRFGEQAKELLPLYDLVPLEMHGQLTDWLDDLPSLGRIEKYRAEDFDARGWLRTSMHQLPGDVRLHEALPTWLLKEDFYLPPGTFRRFDYSDRRALVWVPVDKPTFYTFLRLLSPLVASSRNVLATQVAALGGLVHQHPDLMDTLSKLLLQLLQQCGYYATEAALAVKDLHTAWGCLCQSKSV